MIRPYPLRLPNVEAQLRRPIGPAVHKRGAAITSLPVKSVEDDRHIEFVPAQRNIKIGVGPHSRSARNGERIYMAARPARLPDVMADVSPFYICGFGDIPKVTQLYSLDF